MIKSTVSRRLPMRRASVFPVLLLLFGCGNGLGPANDLSGTWAATYTFPGSSLVLNLSQDGAGITGTGTYVMEAGGAGTLQVVGHTTGPVSISRSTMTSDRISLMSG